jgi:hypothetical protein
MNNRHGLVVATQVTHPGYTAEWDAALEMLSALEPRARRRTLGADKGYDQADFVAAVPTLHTTPHIAPNIHPTNPRVHSTRAPRGTPGTRSVSASGN